VYVRAYKHKKGEHMTNDVIFVELKRIGRKVIGCSLFTDMVHMRVKKNNKPIYEHDLPLPAVNQILGGLAPNAVAETDAASIEILSPISTN
jgi:hypothetical protein